MDDLRKLALEAVRIAKRRAPGGCEVLYIRTDAASRSTDATPKAWHEAQLQVRLFDGRGGVGLAMGPYEGPQDLARVIDQAAAATAPGPEGDTRPAPRLDVVERGLGIDDPRLPLLDEAARAEVLEWNLESLAGIEGVRVGRFEYTEARTQRAYASSRDVELSEGSTLFSLSGAVSALGDPALRLSDTLRSRNFAEVGSKPLGVELGRRVLAMGKPAELPRSQTPVVFEQRAVGALLPKLFAAFSLEAMQSGQSALAGHIGRRVGNTPLHVIDDALRPGGLATRRFDSRGISALPITLLKEGVVAGWYQGTVAAARTDSRSSGHEHPDGRLWMGNLICRAGTRSRNMLFPDMSEFVVIDEVLDTSGVDVASGRVRARVRASTWSGNRCVGYAGERTLDTTIEALFMGVLHLCNDQERHGIVDTPTWVTDGPWFSA